MCTSSFKNFDKNLRFTIRTFGDAVPHFLDAEIRSAVIALFKVAATRV